MQEYHHNPVVFVLQILVKRLLLCNGRNQHIPLKTLFITNYIGMTRTLMKPITSKCNICNSYAPFQLLTQVIAFQTYCEHWIIYVGRIISWYFILHLVGSSFTKRYVPNLHILTSLYSILFNGKIKISKLWKLKSWVQFEVIISFYR